jgi:hypothetical protein
MATTLVEETGWEFSNCWCGDHYYADEPLCVGTRFDTVTGWWIECSDDGCSETMGTCANTVPPPQWGNTCECCE